MKPYEAESNRPASREEDIAIVGMACFFPGADTAGLLGKHRPQGRLVSDHRRTGSRNNSAPDHADFVYRPGLLRDLCRFIRPTRYRANSTRGRNRPLLGVSSAYEAGRCGFP